MDLIGIFNQSKKMGDEAKEVHDRSSGEIEQMTGQINGCSRDLLKRFKPGSNHHLFHHHSTRSSESVAAGATGENDDEEIGLNLGLSLGGCFGVNPRGNTNNNNNNSSSSSLRRSSSANINIININNNNNNYYDRNSNNRIVRSSSSFAGLTTLVRDEDSVVGQQQQQKQQQQPATLCSSSLIRTSSLPMETEEEWRKRKELQSLRRMEAKRKRSEKQQQKNMNMNMIRGCSGKDGKDRASSLEQSCEEDKRVVEVVVENHHRSTSSKQQQQQQGLVGAAAFGLSSWAAALVHGMDSSTVNNGKANNVGGGGGSQPRPQGSLGSQGSTSGISESLQGMSNCTESRSPSSVQSLPEQQIEHKPTIVLPKRMPEKSSASAITKGEDQAEKIPKILENGVVEETGMKVMEEMPCVSTKGDGPNGKRIEGFLYKYRKGEEVRIVCVCHGNFLSPAEFVKHAGGGDVAHPLRHIVVNPSPSFL